MRSVGRPRKHFTPENDRKGLCSHPDDMTRTMCPSDVQDAVLRAICFNAPYLIIKCNCCGCQNKIVVEDWLIKWVEHDTSAGAVTVHMERKDGQLPVNTQPQSGKPSSGKSKLKGKYKPCRMARLE